MKINNKELNQELITKILVDTKSKKEFSTLADSVVQDEAVHILKHSKKQLDFLANNQEQLEKLDKNSQYKSLIKELRSKFRTNFGVFQIQKEDVKQIIDNTTLDNQEQHINLLNSHKSTKERIDLYQEDFFKTIFEKTITPNSILDLGCGYNPFAYYYMQEYVKKENFTYFASDISDNSLELISYYFNKFNIDNKTKVIDLKKIKTTPNIINDFTKTKVDITFLFKLFDSIETSGHKLAELILENVNSKYIIVSFATELIKNIRMNHPYRGWMDRLLERLGYTFEYIEFDNELFYLIKTSN